MRWNNGRCLEASTGWGRLWCIMEACNNGILNGPEPELLRFVHGRTVMTLAQLEQRISSLEKTLEELQARLPLGSDLAPATNGENAVPGEEDIIPGAEYPV